MAVGFHHQLVLTHAFLKGKGRHARLMANLLTMRLVRPRLTCVGGEASITVVEGFMINTLPPYVQQTRDSSAI
jgi:hypothetical protein